MLDGNNNLIAVFTHGPEIDEPLMMKKADGTEFFLHADGVSSIVAHTDAAGNVVERIEYEAYGKAIFLDVRGPPSESDRSLTGSPYAFTSRELDYEIGLYYFRARYYEPNVGRFLTEDPTGVLSLNNYFYVDSVGELGNAYHYAFNNPVGYTDPLGLRPLTDREKSYLSPYIPWQDLQNADIHEGQVPWYLPGQYVGITRGNDIYFRPGYYDAYTPEGLAILGHELVHVGQYREGATWPSFLWSYRHGYENSKYEIAAYAMQKRILYGLTHPEAGACGR